MEISTTDQGEIHELNERSKEDKRREAREESVQMKTFFGIISVIGLAFSALAYDGITKSGEARKVVESIEISEAQRRILEEYGRVMNELDDQVADLSGGKLSIKDEPPKVYGMLIPLNLKTNNKNL